MPYFAGLDVSLEFTSICLVDESGAIVRELKAVSDRAELQSALQPFSDELVRVGLEAGPMCQYLYSGLIDAGFPAICVEPRHMAQALRAQSLNKTDRNDARGIAQMMRVGLFKIVHVKTEQSQRLNVLLRARKILKSKVLDIEADLRGVLKNFGLKIGKVTTDAFAHRVRELAAFDPLIEAVVEPVFARTASAARTIRSTPRDAVGCCSR